MNIFLPVTHRLEYDDDSESRYFFSVENYMPAIISSRDHIPGHIKEPINLSAGIPDYVYAVIANHSCSDSQICIVRGGIDLVGGIYQNAEDAQICYEEIHGYEFLLDSSLTAHEKLVMYINVNKGYEYITLEEYYKLLEEK
jgi:hypothetical protein